MEGPADDTRVRIMHGGPFYEAMKTLGLRPRGWRAFVFVSVCWTLPLLMSLALQGSQAASGFMHDWGAWAKFLIAPALLTLAEKPISFALDECSTLMFRIPIVTSQSMPDARAALRHARSRTTAMAPEIACILIAIAASALNAANFLDGASPSWAIAEGRMTAAGLWCIAISNTLYWFLLCRLAWKHLVWAGFLSALARCRLRLAITHPDGHAGLGFVGLVPSGSALLTLAVSSVVAAGVGHVMQHETVTPTSFTVVCAGWLAVVLLYHALPLAGLSAQIARLKRKAVMQSLSKATDHERETERSILGENIISDEAEAGSGTTADVATIYQASLKASALLLNRKTVLPVLVPALLPLLLVGASYLSYSQLGPIAKRLLLL
jgi:hypothetical protein